MRKIFHLLDGFKIGGIENLAFTLSSVDKPNINNYLININDDLNIYLDNYFTKDKFKNLKIISLKKKKGIFLTLRIIKLLDREKPSNIIIYFNNITSLWVLIGAKLLNINNVAICIQNSIEKLSFRNLKSIFLMRLFNLFGVKLVPCSKAILNSYLLIDKKLRFEEVIPNCINVEHFKEEFNEAKKITKKNNLKTIIMIARLDEIKDQETLIKAYSRIKDDCNLILIGNGTKRLYLEELAINLGLNPKDIFCGSRLDIPQLLAKADIFAFSTSFKEGFGIALIEAMAAELPIIASDVPACREVLDDGKAGILIPVKDVDTWTKELYQMISSREIRDFYSRKSIKNLKNYNVQTVFNMWSNIFER